MHKKVGWGYRGTALWDVPTKGDQWELRSQRLAEAVLWKENIRGQIKGRALIPGR